MRLAVPPFPNTPSWRGAQLKSTGTTLHYITIAYIICNHPDYILRTCLACFWQFMEHSPWEVNSPLGWSGTRSMEQEGSLSCSQELVTDPYPEPDESSPHHNPVSWRFILPFTHGSYKWYPSALPTKILYAFLISPIRITCPVYLNLLDLITLTVFGEEYRLWSASLCSFL
jgi:hypothetical protein